MTILVCTSPTSQDPQVPRVVDALRERGLHVCVLNADRFPLDATMTVEHGGPATLELAHARVDLRAVSAVWLPHFEVGAALGDDVDQDFHEAVAAQGELALWDLLAACERALFVDDPRKVARVPLGNAQLALASAAGLEVPRTLTSNDPERVRSFAADCGGQVVTKLLHSSMVMRMTPAGPRGYPPRLLAGDELQDLEALRLCPQLFQAPVPKQLEIRVTVVGSRLFSAAVDTRSASGLDWGEDPELISAFVPYELPESVASSILALLDRVGLQFSTVDLILTPDGRHVFLEINPISYFGFVERAAKLPIGAAIASLLAGELAPRLP